MGPYFSFKFLVKNPETGNYSIVIAAAGQASTQTPQSTQASPTMALPSTILIASLGHSLTQVSQPVHLSTLTFADIYKILSMQTLK